MLACELVCLFQRILRACCVLGGSSLTMVLHGRMQGSQKQFAFVLLLGFLMGVVVHVFSSNGPVVDNGGEWVVVAPNLRARNSVHKVDPKVGGQTCNTTLCCSFARPLSSPFCGLSRVRFCVAFIFEGALRSLANGALRQQRSLSLRRCHG